MSAPDPPVPAVQARGVHKRYCDVAALCGVDLDVERREVVCVIGPSGSGKSTFIRCINHLERIDEGEILVNGHPIGYRRTGGRLVEDRDRNVARQRQEVGMVFQRFNLFPHMTAAENVKAGPVRVRRVDRREADELAARLLARVGLSDKRDQYPAQLSGGQQQRVAIARSRCAPPSCCSTSRPARSTPR
jgi:polar amino acid transport system ATP-binding protein